MNVETADRLTSAPTRALAEWLAALQPGDIPDGTRQAIRAALLDTLGVGLYGLDQAWTRAARAWAERGAEPAGAAGALASLWGDGRRRLRPCDAALVNGVAAHAFELDDFHNAKLHPGAVVVPAALALGEALDVSGERLELALVAGYEVMIRAGLALDPSVARLRGWHLTGVCGGLGAAVRVRGAARARRRARRVGARARRHPGIRAVRLQRRRRDEQALPPGSRGAVGRARRRAGVARLQRSDPAVRDCGRRLPVELLRRGAAGRADPRPRPPLSAQRHRVQALLVLRQPAFLHRRRARAAAEVSGGADAARARRHEPCGRRAVRLRLPAGQRAQRPDERALLPCRGAARRRRAAGAVHAARVASGDVVALAEAIELVPDPALDAIYPAHFIGWVELEDERVTVRDPSGSPENPARDAALRQKFHSLLAARVTEAARARLEAAVDALERTSARALGDLLTVQP